MCRPSPITHHHHPSPTNTNTHDGHGSSGNHTRVHGGMVAWQCHNTTRHPVTHRLLPVAVTSRPPTSTPTAAVQWKMHPQHGSVAASQHHHHHAHHAVKCHLSPITHHPPTPIPTAAAAAAVEPHLQRSSVTTLPTTMPTTPSHVAHCPLPTHTNTYGGSGNCTHAAAVWLRHNTTHHAISRLPSPIAHQHQHPWRSGSGRNRTHGAVVAVS